ncbi:carboxymuconolactone decarboxylase family protein [Caballeronia sp. GAWG1-1]|uniref:carboxymuconolactone decarboxylase family protein n=1 Tax=Caballeronia sp. GAWG1-1 TaxID=2921742 RepID=UPI002028DDFD|nr:carboxymuconolactone decarboxylase family protein [Caballeronia sp. GAWG1-1]
MPFVSYLADNATPLAVYEKYPAIYRPWSDMSEALMNGDSQFSQAERELLFSYAAGATGCEFVCIAHSEVAYARGVERGTVEVLLRDPQQANVDDRLRPVLALVQKLAAHPADVTQADVDAVFAAGWGEDALHSAIAIAGRAAFMHRVVAGFGLVSMGREVAAQNAERRVKQGYVKLVAAFEQTGNR